MNAPRPHLLPAKPGISPALLRQVCVDHDRFAAGGLPGGLEEYMRETYNLDVTASYAGLPLRNPWGKASGQLTLNIGQLQEAERAGLGFAILKTVIAQDAAGQQSMGAWAVKESRMVPEPITSPITGATGWTITWKGRGWWQSFDDYLALVQEGAALGRNTGMPVIPSVKYHLPGPGETDWKTEEYVGTTNALLDAWQRGGGTLPMPLEKDFSPTLAGSDLAAARPTVLEWLRRVPELVRSAGAEQVRLGLKLFNSLDNDDFQLSMLAATFGPRRPDFLIYANRLFDPHRSFEGQTGVAYGGPDLSDRNLRLLSRLRRSQDSGLIGREPLELSATGDISSGKLALEYALRGASSFQFHTLFQLPQEVFAMRKGSRIERALHRLYFDPDEGFIVWARHAAEALKLTAPGGMVRFLDIAARGAGSAIERRDLDPEPS